MSTPVSTIITDAYRESNLIPMGTAPNPNQQTEGLGRLNTLVKSTIGNEAGDGFSDLNVGGTFDQTPDVSDYVPDDIRLLLNLSTPLTVNLDPYPFAGQRMGFIDVAGTLATCPLTINGNGRLVEGVSSLVLNTPGDARQYFYRDDIGQWVKVSTLLYTDTMPFPDRFDDYFTTVLAARLNPRYGQSLSPESQEALKRARSQLRAHYHAWEEIRSDLDTRGYLSDPRAYWAIEATDFKTGRPFPWR